MSIQVHIARAAAEPDYEVRLNTYRPEDPFATVTYGPVEVTTHDPAVARRYAAAWLSAAERIEQAQAAHAAAQDGGQP